MVLAISLLSIQHFGKEHGSGTHSASRLSAPNCSIHCACRIWGPNANETEMGAALFIKMVMEER